MSDPRKLPTLMTVPEVADLLRTTPPALYTIAGASSADIRPRPRRYSGEKR